MVYMSIHKYKVFKFSVNISFWLSDTLNYTYWCLQNHSFRNAHRTHETVFHESIKGSYLCIYIMSYTLHVHKCVSITRLLICHIGSHQSRSYHFPSWNYRVALGLFRSICIVGSRSGLQPRHRPRRGGLPQRARGASGHWNQSSSERSGKK